mmetsp:Transcript_146843/g.256218  ORF Transcript_146843/g.256218 Transcript_146843/m.256218 type:complete len:526 (+) Transcript_146843:138-1715(+)
MSDKGMGVSLANFDETNAKTLISSPRSLQACKTEGVLPQELVFKPIEAFMEKNLSPRLVKLRYDFFEAKRRDLLAATRKARDSILAEERREKENNQLDVLAQQSGLSKGAILALNSDGLKLERDKLLRAQEHERNWLKNALRNELQSLQAIETHNQRLQQEADSDAEKTRMAAQRLKELNDKRAQQEERKAMEAEARQKLEKQIAKEEFMKQQEELKKKGEIEAQKQKEAYQRQLNEMVRKKKVEEQKAEAREAAYRDQQARKEEMRAQDLKRADLMEQQKMQFQEAMREKKEMRDLRIYQSIENNMEIERLRRSAFEEKQKQDQLREERLAQDKALMQEEAAKKSYMTMMRRKQKQEEATRKMEERRDCIIEQQEETECRLLEHEQKKERYLDFKRELDGLRSKNKEINVERQRRKEEAQREAIAEGVRRKDEKMEWLTSERRRLWQIRRATQSEAYRAREMVKNEIMRQRIASKFNSKELAKRVNGHMSHDLFSPEILQTSTSMPLLRAGEATQASQASQDGE